MRRGFTLLELIIVIVIVGVLGTLGFAQYTRLAEKARAAEAKDILGQLRTAQNAYNTEYGANTATIANLAISAPTGCATSHYFTYGTDTLTGTATRCTTSAGKSPSSGSAYTVTLIYTTSAWGGSAGYF